MHHKDQAASEKAARNIKLLVLDVDGVLTDGGLYYDASGQCMKRFSAVDGLGIKDIADYGIQTAVITGLASEAVRARMKDLRIKYYVEGETRKIPPLEEFRRQCGVEWSEIAYIGDDWVDLAPMSRVGFPVAVANAMPEVKDAAMAVTELTGGNGAVREAIWFMLQAQGKLEPLLEFWKGQ